MAFTGTVYYITRTWVDKGKANSCALVRVHYAELLSRFGKVVVVTPNYDSAECILREDLISFPYDSSRTHFHQRMEYLRLEFDYLKTWVKPTLAYLLKTVGKDDLVFATSGGELACIYIGAKLKERTGCRFFVNFRDPVNGATIHGRRVPYYRGPGRSRAVEKYVGQADLLITSSESYAQVLREKHPQKAQAVVNHYVGYMETMPARPPRALQGPVNIVYSGAMSMVQGAEILGQAVRGLENVRVTYICPNAQAWKSRMPEDNVQCIPLMPHQQYLQYMETHADVGFFSLADDYYGVCVPSKLYEYINLGLPVLASVPQGSAADIVRENDFGLACQCGDAAALRQAVETILQPENYRRYAEAIARKRGDWYSGERDREFYALLEQAL